MNTNMTGLNVFFKNFASLCMAKVASTLEGLKPEFDIKVFSKSFPSD